MVGKAMILAYVALAASSCGAFAFVAPLQARASLADVGRSPRVSAAATRDSSTIRPTMEMEELEQLNDAIAGKRIEVVDEAQGIGKYEFSVEAPGSMTQRLDHRIKRVIRDKSDFPGHMKGQIPMQLMPEVNKFVVEEIMNDSILMALETYGLVGAEGEGSEAELNTDMNEMIATFKPGKPLSFTCTINAKAKPETDPEDSAAAQDATLSDSS